MEKLLAFLPKKEGTILDVACGKGATTRYLLRYFKSENVTGINISEKQLARCRENAPGCTFLLMSATELKFADESFDNISCVEAAFHFVTREKFVQEALRVLRPGGRIVLSDNIVAKWKEESSGPHRSAKNYVRDLGEYREVFSRVGFAPVHVVDATCPCWLQFYRREAIRTRKQFRLGILPLARYERRMQRLNHKLEFIRYYVLACAQKPQRAQQADT